MCIRDRHNMAANSLFRANGWIDSCSVVALFFHGHPSESVIGSAPFGLGRRVSQISLLDSCSEPEQHLTWFPQPAGLVRQLWASYA
eukprot:4191370-Pyramimonas_sp.AAC.1